MTGIELIVIEREEQLKKHKYTLKHDQDHERGELAKAAAVLAVHHTDAIVQDDEQPFETNGDPWGLESKLCKSNNKDELIHRLKVAGALIAAEIDRIN